MCTFHPDLYTLSLHDALPIFQRFLDKHGEGLHHIALEVDNIHQRLETLKSEGLPLINEQPKKGAHNADIAFIHPKATGGVLIELCQHDGGSHAYGIYLMRLMSYTLIAV